jgi:hypothetical protein
MDSEHKIGPVGIEETDGPNEEYVYNVLAVWREETHGKLQNFYTPQEMLPYLIDDEKLSDGALDVIESYAKTIMPLIEPEYFNQTRQINYDEIRNFGEKLENFHTLLSEITDEEEGHHPSKLAQHTYNINLKIVESVHVPGPMKKRSLYDSSKKVPGYVCDIFAYEYMKHNYDQLVQDLYHPQETNPERNK